jgi:prolyl oligopeptidase
MTLRHCNLLFLLLMLVLLVLLLPICPLAPARGDSAARLAYPEARAEDVADEYHGTKVSDPYRWLEDDSSAETRAFVEAQNALARSFIDGPVREQIKQRLLEVWKYPRYTNPSREGRFYTFSKNDGLQPQSVLYVQDALRAEPRVLIDPNTFSNDGTVSLSGTTFSEDGMLLAYGVSVAGSDQKDILVRSVGDGKDLADELKHCKFSSVAWKHDNSGFFYDRYPKPGSVPKSEETFNNKLYWHQLGTPQEQDVLVYERPDDKELSFGPSITKDGKYLVLYVSRGSAPMNRIYVREVEGDRPFIKLIDEEIARFRMIGNDGPVFYFQTNDDAPRGRVIAIDLNNPVRGNWKTLVGESDDAINWFRMINDQFVACYLKDARHVLKLFKRDGTFEKEIELPTVGTVNVTGERDHDEMFVSFTSITYPATIFRYDFKTGALELFRKSEAKFDPQQYETKQIFATSKDGTRVPIFVAHRKGLKLDGSNPTILNGYGGFNVGIGPGWNHARIAWLEQGGVFAQAVLRGGDEYGERWHQSGMLGNKQNVFDDFIAAAEHLCKERYTNPKRLAIEGGSNGGLLVAACTLQRPDAFGAVLCHVPVTDMLRYHRFTAGRFWVHEYGNAEKDPEHFKFMYAYSPLHNVQEGAAYPPILVKTAEGDDRVVPMHARKFVATLQAKSSGTNPILLFTQTRAGHGGGKPTKKIIEETADSYAFLAKIFEMQWKSPNDAK